MNARFAFIDLETAPLGWDGWPNALIQPPEPAVLAIQRRQKKAPSNYVNEDAIQRWHDRQREGAHDAANSRSLSALGASPDEVARSFATSRSPSADITSSA